MPGNLNRHSSNGTGRILQSNGEAATNCDEVELFLNNRSLGKKPVSSKLYFNDWNVNYQPGGLTAVGYNKGKKVATSKLVTAGAATKLQITPLPIFISSDVLLFEITVVDKAGVNVVDAKDAITVKVEGNGKLIGLDNGELDYTGAFKTNTRNAYQGRLLVSVQKTSPASGISVTASAPGLSSAIFQTK